MHGGINVIDNDGSRIAVSLVLRLVNSSRQYTDKMVYNNQKNSLCPDHIFEKIDVQLYHSNLLRVYRNNFFV